jgi:hypothetical protein
MDSTARVVKHLQGSLTVPGQHGADTDTVLLTMSI